MKGEERDVLAMALGCADCKVELHGDPSPPAWAFDVTLCDVHLQQYVQSDKPKAEKPS